MITVKLPDGKELKFDSPPTAAEVAQTIGAGLARAAIAAKVNGNLVDLSTVIKADSEISVITTRSPEAEGILRHSCAHIMAAAVGRLFENVVFGIGPATDNGFYYDFDVASKFTPDDFARIEKEMAAIIAEGTAFEREEMPREQAIELFRKSGQILKAELLEDIEEDTVSIYRSGDFVDLCRGPHVPSSDRMPAFKLTKLAGAYWRGDVHRKMLQRIYAIAFADKKALKAHLRMLEEAKKRDHRRIGKEMDLFSFHEEGPGFPFFHPKGVVVLNEIISYWRAVHTKDGYKEIVSPPILNCDLWRRSGHYDNYAENMYFTEIDKREYAVRPMNCPGAMLIYKSRPHSYKELPLRVMEMGRVHRHELSGVLHGLFRVRTFLIDDAHIYCTPEQVEEEVSGIIHLLTRIYKAFGFSDWQVELSTRPEKSIGTDSDWEYATDYLHSALKRTGIEYKVDEGAGAFYGPKIDFKTLDSIGRLWQCGTIQVDFSMPNRFELEYTGPDGQLHRPVLIHRAILGALERFLGVLIENCAGKFPLWLAPVQAKVLTITSSSDDYARELENRLQASGLRVELDLRNEKIGYKVHHATKENVPYMLIVGDKEVSSGRAALRHRTEGDLGPKEIDDIISGLQEEIRAKSADPVFRRNGGNKDKLA